MSYARTWLTPRDTVVHRHVVEPRERFVLANVDGFDVMTSDLVIAGSEVRRLREIVLRTAVDKDRYSSPDWEGLVRTIDGVSNFEALGLCQLAALRCPLCDPSVYSTLAREFRLRRDRMQLTRPAVVKYQDGKSDPTVWFFSRVEDANI